MRLRTEAAIGRAAVVSGLAVFIASTTVAQAPAQPSPASPAVPPPSPTAPPTQAPAADRPAPTATIAYPGPGPADASLRALPLPNGRTLHLLPATLETTQWGWFDNSQPPVLRIKAGDSVALETMMHSHNQVVPGTTIEQIKKLRTDFPGRGPHTVTGPIYVAERSLAMC
jgi:hypothetical protein